jgi:hypothetical protein
VGKGYDTDAQHALEISNIMQIQKLLADLKERVDSNDFFYTRFFGIGLFRLLEITKARDPKALEGLVSVCSDRSDNFPNRVGALEADKGSYIKSRTY